MKKTRVALVYNAYVDGVPESIADSGGMRHLRRMIRGMARAFRKGGTKSPSSPLAEDLQKFQRTSPAPEARRRLQPVRRRRPRRALRDAAGGARPDDGLSHHRIARAGAGPEPLQVHVRQPAPGRRAFRSRPITTLLERIARRRPGQWQFPLIVQPSQEHAGIGAGTRFRRPHEEGPSRRKSGTSSGTTASPPWRSGSSRAASSTSASSGGRSCACCRWPRWTIPGFPGHPADHVLCGQVDRQTSVEYQSTSVICPAVVESELAAAIADTAVRAFRAVGGWGYGRVDIRLDEDSVPRACSKSTAIRCSTRGWAWRGPRRSRRDRLPRICCNLIVKAALRALRFDVGFP